MYVLGILIMSPTTYNRCNISAGSFLVVLPWYMYTYIVDLLNNHNMYNAGRLTQICHFLSYKQNSMSWVLELPFRDGGQDLNG